MNYIVSIANKFEIEILEVGIENIKLNTKEYLASQVRGDDIEYDLYPGVLNQSTSLKVIQIQLDYKLYGNSIP